MLPNDFVPFASLVAYLLGAVACDCLPLGAVACSDCHECCTILRSLKWHVTLRNTSSLFFQIYLCLNSARRTNYIYVVWFQNI
jgi:hypothetical protein